MKLGYYFVRSWPFIGAAVAALTIIGTIRKKGIVGGTVDTALNAVPYLGAMKTLIEAGRGRDLIPARTPRPRTNARSRNQTPQ